MGLEIVLPPKGGGEWIKAECDETGEAAYQLRPLKKRWRLWVQQAHTHYEKDEYGRPKTLNKKAIIDRVDGTNAIWDLARIMLSGIKGISYRDENGELKEYKLEFVKISVMGVLENAVEPDCFDNLPDEFIAEIIEAAAGAIGITGDDEEEDEDGVGFTSDSLESKNARDATETNQPVQ